MIKRLLTKIKVGRREEIGKEEEERKPEYMHPFFGDDEEIEGYIDPHLSLIFSRYSFKLYIKFEYKEKREEKKKRGIMTSLPPTQVIEKLLPFFPNDAITYDLDVFCNWLDIDRRSASPFGDLVATYFPSDVKSNNNNNNNTENNEGKKEEEEVTYEVRWCKFIEGGDRNEELIRFHERIQLFVLLEIDGGTFIETNDHRWELFLLYEHHSANGKGKGSKGKGMGKGRDSLLGYCSAYEFYHHPDQFRVRISQFLLFPQYQRKGHGRNLLNAIYKHAIARNVLDIPVEDPSLDFSRLRDMVDMSNLILGRYFSPSQKSISADQIKLIVLKHRLWKVPFPPPSPSLSFYYFLVLISEFIVYFFYLN